MGAVGTMSPWRQETEQYNFPCFQYDWVQTDLYSKTEIVFLINAVRFTDNLIKYVLICVNSPIGTVISPVK